MPLELLERERWRLIIEFINDAYQARRLSLDGDLG